MSLRNDLDPEAHLIAGRAIASLRDEGVLIVGSGMSFHNMRGYGDKKFSLPFKVFDEWLTETVTADSEEQFRVLCDWSQAPHAIESHILGAEKHLIPLMLAVGAAGTDQGKKIYFQQVLETHVSGFPFG